MIQACTHWAISQRQGEIIAKMVVREGTRKPGIERAGTQQEKRGRKMSPGRGKFQEEVGTAWRDLETKAA